MWTQFKRGAYPTCGTATFGHFLPAVRHQGVTARTSGAREMSPQGQQKETDMRDSTTRTYPGTPFGVLPGERWRRFLERVGTRSLDFPVRLARARFVYLHRRDTGAHWLPI